MMGKIGAVGWIEWKAMLSSLIFLPYAAWLLKIYGYDKTSKRMLRAEKKIMGDPNQQLALALQLSRGVNMATKYYPYGTNCLKKSLVLARLLARYGIEYEIKFGVAREKERFRAHAWVVSHHLILNDEQNVNAGFIELKSPGRNQF